MTKPHAKRRNPPRRCRNKPSNDDATFENIKRKSNDSSSTEEQLRTDDDHVPTGEPENQSESAPSEYEASDQGLSVHEDASSEDFEVENRVSVSSKRQAKDKDSGLRKSKKTKRNTNGTKLSLETGACQWSEKQMGILDRIFSELDTNKNGRITISDIMRAAEDYGLDFGPDEARDMVRFWDSSGTVTISRGTFTKLAIDSKFMVPASR